MIRKSNHSNYSRWSNVSDELRWPVWLDTFFSRRLSNKSDGNPRVKQHLHFKREFLLISLMNSYRMKLKRWEEKCVDLILVEWSWSFLDRARRSFWCFQTDLKEKWVINHQRIDKCLGKDNSKMMWSFCSSFDFIETFVSRRNWFNMFINIKFIAKISNNMSGSREMIRITIGNLCLKFIFTCSGNFYQIQWI